MVSYLKMSDYASSLASYTAIVSTGSFKYFVEIDTMQTQFGVCQKWKSETIEVSLTFHCYNKTLTSSCLTDTNVHIVNSIVSISLEDGSVS